MYTNTVGCIISMLTTKFATIYMVPQALYSLKVLRGAFLVKNVNAILGERSEVRGAFQKVLLAL